MPSPDRTPPGLAAAGKAGIKACPRCACGVARDAAACEYCGAQLGILPDRMPGVTAVVCARCSTVNHPSARACFRCRAELVHVCPRCSAEISPSLAVDCPGCGLPRGHFLSHCVGIAEAGRRSRAEHARSRERRGLTRLVLFSAASAAVLIAGALIAFIGDAGIGSIVMLASIIPLAAALVLALGTRQDPRRRPGRR